MPGRDRTGPRGMGPMTGRGMGYCADAGAPGYANPGFGRGFGGGRGWGGGGRGWRHRFYATGQPGWARGAYAYGPAFDYPPPPTPEQETQSLKSEAEWLKRQLDAISQRIEELESK